MLPDSAQTTGSNLNQTGFGIFLEPINPFRLDSVKIATVASSRWCVLWMPPAVFFLSASILLSPFCLLCFQAAADFAKTHLPEALRQQLLIYARDRERDKDKDKDREKADRKERSGLSYPSILEQQILNVDREMLDKLSASYNEAGAYVLIRKPCQDSGATQFLLLWECEVQRCGCPHDPRSHMFLWGGGPGGLSRCFRWRLNISSTICSRNASGQHQHCFYTSSLPSPACFPPPHFFFCPRVLLNRGRQQPRGRAYSAV